MGRPEIEADPPLFFNCENENSSASKTSERDRDREAEEEERDKVESLSRYLGVQIEVAGSRAIATARRVGRVRRPTMREARA